MTDPRAPLSELINHSWRLSVYCAGEGSCGKDRQLRSGDLSRIAAAKGMDYTLYNRRTRCRLTAGCPGWNYFLFDHVTYKMAMFDPEQAARWRGEMTTL